MVKYLVHFFSYALHPLLMLTYILVILLMVNPYMFGVSSIGDYDVLILLMFLTTFAIPAFAALLMKLLGLINSLQMEDKQERIGPYIITGVFYLWIFRYLLERSEVPIAYKIFVLGATIALFIAFFINLFSKISIHAVGMGGLIAMVLITMKYFSYPTFPVNAPLFGSMEISMNGLLIFVLVLSGIVGSSRLYLKAHTLPDILGGYFVGFIAQFIALRFLFY